MSQTHGSAAIHRIVIVGAGQGGLQAAASLRDGGFTGTISLLGEEPHLPYQRPPLSKAYMLGTLPAASLGLKSPGFFVENDIDLRLRTRVIGIDRANGTVQVESTDGFSRESLAYDRLILATGATPRRLNCPGADLDGIFTFRDLTDANAIQAALSHAQDVVVIGGGFIGLEFAAVAAKLGRRVTVIEAQPRLLARVAAPAISDFFMAEHRAHGVTMMMAASVAGFAGAQGRISGVSLTSGVMVPADLVVIGVGVVPNDQLARQAGLATGNGIIVDQCLRTDDPAIFAIGDVAAHSNPFAGERIRVESVQNAVDQGRCVAACILGSEQPYQAVPWFWSDQYDLKLQTAGLNHGYDLVVQRGDPSTRKFSLFYFRCGQFVAVDSVNAPADHMVGRRLLAAGRSPSPADVMDVRQDVKQLLADSRAA